MKSLIVTLTALFSIIGTSSKANDIKVSDAIRQSFETTFKSSSDVRWTAGSGYYKAEFTYNKQVLTAYFDTDGVLFATTENVKSSELPLLLQRNLKRELDGMWITDLFQVNDDNGTSYYAALENAESKVVLKSTGSKWSVYQKQTKS